MDYVTRQAPLSMGFSWQEYWGGLPGPPPEVLPNPGIELLKFLAWVGRFFTTSATWEAQSVQFSLVAQLCPTLCDPMDCNMSGLSVHHQLPELAQTNVH